MMQMKETDLDETRWLQMLRIAVIGVEPAVKYSFVYKGIQKGRKGQYKAELTLSPRLHVKPLPLQ